MSFSGGIKTATAGLGGMVKSIAGVVAAYAGFRQIVSFGKDIVETGVQFEKGMAEVSAISGATGEELAALADKAKEMGAKTKFSALESAEAMKYMGMAGWSSGQMIDGIEGIMNLAAASGEDLGSVSDIVTDSLTAFGLAAKDSAAFADVLAVASSKSNTNVALLGESFKNCAATAGAMGYSYTDVTAALGTMANAGIKGGAAGTALNSVMTRLAKPTKDVTTALNALGVSAVNSDGSMKSLADLIPELQSKFQNLSESERGQYATMIAGKNAMSGFLTLVNASTDDWNSLSDAIYNADGTAKAMSDTMNDTVSGRLTLLKSQFEGVKLAIFDGIGSSKFKDVLAMVGDGLTAITPYVTDLAVRIGNGLFTAIDRVREYAVTAFTWIKAKIEENRPAIEAVKATVVTVISAVKTAAEKIFGFFVSALRNVKTAVQDNAERFAVLGPILGKIGEIASKLWAIIRPALLWLKDTAVPAVVTALSYLMPVIDGILGFVSGAIDVIVSVAGAVADVCVKVYHYAVQMLTPVANAFVSAWELIRVVWGYVEPFFASVWEGIQFVFSAVVTVVGGVFSTAWEVVKGVWNAASSFFQTVWNTVAGIFSVVKDVLTGNFSAAWEGIKSIFSGVGAFFAGVWETIKNMFTTIGTVIGDAISGAFKAVVNAVISFAEGMINGFIDSINGAIGLINLIPGVNIGLISRVDLPKLAQGGTVDRPGGVIVGERGPEMLNLPRGASVTPLPKTGGNTFYITINAADRSTEEIVDDLMPKLRLALDTL